jgi:GNAT superfamily N-acetyltransferase
VFQVEDALVRLVVPEDAADVVEVGRAVDPDSLATTATMRALLEAEAPAATERLVCERDGRIVAWAPSGRYDSGAGWFWVGVLPESRRHGIGRAIYEHIERRLRELGVDSIETTPNDEDGRCFLVTRGFAISATVRVSEIDPRSVETQPAPPDGVEIVALRDVIGHPKPLFELYVEGREDVPSSTPRPPWTYEEWRHETLDHPLLDLDASTVVLESGEPVSLAWLYSDRDGARAETLMAATRRASRGGGLATLAKIDSTRRAAALGITRILTSNDVDNAPMLAINQRLGYTPSVVIDSYTKQL